jgi:hypothetical protein
MKCCGITDAHRLFVRLEFRQQLSAAPSERKDFPSEAAFQEWKQYYSLILGFHWVCIFSLLIAPLQQIDSSLATSLSIPGTAVGTKVEKDIFTQAPRTGNLQEGSSIAPMPMVSRRPAPATPSAGNKKKVSRVVQYMRIIELGLNKTMTFGNDRRKAMKLGKRAM